MQHGIYLSRRRKRPRIGIIQILDKKVMTLVILMTGGLISVKDATHDFDKDDLKITVRTKTFFQYVWKLKIPK